MSEDESLLPITHGEAQEFLDAYVDEVRDHPSAFVARSLTTSTVRQLFGLEAGDCSDAPTLLGHDALVHFQPVPLGFMAMMRSNYPPAGFPPLYGIVFGVMEIKPTKVDPSTWPEYRVDQQ